MNRSKDFKALMKNKDFRKLKRKLAKWIQYSSGLEMTSDPHDCLSVMQRQGNISLFTVIEYIAARTSTSIATDTDDGMLGFSYAIVNSAFANYSVEAHSATIHNSSSGSGCSSCSSCGGCGGCGGGGAD